MGNMDTLVETGTTAAWVYSAIVTIDPSAFPSSGVYFDAAVMINTLEIRLSKKTLQKIKQNLFRAFAYNSVLIPIAA